MVQLTNAQLVLIKDKDYKPRKDTLVIQAQYKNCTLFSIKIDKSTLLTWAKHPTQGDQWIQWQCNEPIQQQIQNLIGQTFEAFQVNLDTPIESEVFPWVLCQNYCTPQVSTNVPCNTFSKLMVAHPEVQHLNLSKKAAYVHHTVVPSQPDQSDILRQLLGTFSNTLVAQPADETIQRISTQVKQANNEIMIQNCTFQIFESILFGKLVPLTATDTKDDSTYKPVITDSQIIPEILKTHQTLKCGPTNKVIANIKSRYFHQYGITSNISLEKMCKDLLPCYICIIGRASHVRAPLYLETQTIGLQCLGVKSCTYTVMDVVYLAQTRSPHFKDPYLSVILCQSCKFLSLQFIPEINSSNLANHLLEFCQLSGRIQHVLISDAASTQVAGEMRKLLKDFQLIHVTANKRIVSTTRAHSTYANANADDNTQQPTAEAWEDSSNNTKTHEGTPLDHLSKEHKQLLLQDVQKSVPSLYNTILTHNPVSYKSSHSSTETSMGSLDNMCKRLQIFLKKFFLDVPPSSNMKDHVEMLVKSFVYLNNFKQKAAFTNELPAVLHLGLQRTNTIAAMMENIQRFDLPNSQAISNMQQILQYAETFRQAEKQAHQVHKTQQERQLRQHGKLLDGEQLLQQLRPFTVLFVKAELGKVPKMHFYAQYCGPFLVLSVNPNSKSVYLFSLISGEVHKKSYRQIRLAFTTNQLFSAPIYGHLNNEIQFKMIEKFSYFNKTPSKDEIVSNTQKILINLYKLLVFLQPILPSMAATKNVLELTLDDDDHLLDHTGNEYTTPTEETPSTTIHPTLEPVQSNEKDTTTKQDNQDKQVRFTFQGDTPAENQIRDIIPKKPSQTTLHEMPEQRTNPEERSPTTKRNTDASFTPSRPKESSSTEELPTDRRSKYTLRQNPRKKIHPDFV